MKHFASLAVACVFGLGIAAARLSAGDDSKPSGDKPAGEKPADKPDKPIKNLKDLMERMQKQSSQALLAARGNSAPDMLAAVKKVAGYAEQIEKWMPDKVSKDDAKKKRFLELLGTTRKGIEESVKLLEASDLKKGSAEYAKANATCTNCHNEFRPKR
jgi:hypothetical protein